MPNLKLVLSNWNVLTPANNPPSLNCTLLLGPAAELPAELCWKLPSGKYKPVPKLAMLMLPPTTVRLSPTLMLLVPMPSRPNSTCVLPYARRLPNNVRVWLGTFVPMPRRTLLLSQKNALLFPLNALALPANCMVPGVPKLGVLRAAVSWNVPSLNTTPLVVLRVLVM